MTRAATPQTLPLGFPTTRVERDGRIAIARFGPLDPAAGGAIARHADLLAPAKLALADDGSLELHAEVLASGDADARALARDALDRGRGWLDGASPEARASAASAEDLAGALAELPTAWAWERGDDGALRIHATAFGESVRIAVASAGGEVQVIARSAMPAPRPAQQRALQRFALESNRRLRLARIGLSASGDDALGISWDVVAPPDAELSTWLPVAVEAVARAHAATRTALRALAHNEVARAYLDARAVGGREAAPRRRRSPGGRKRTDSTIR